MSDTTDTPIMDAAEAWNDRRDLLAQIGILERQLADAQTKIERQAERIRYLEGATNHANGTALSRMKKERDDLERQLAEARGQRDRLAEALRGIKDRCTDETIKLHPDADAKGCVDDCLEWSEQALASLERKEEG